MKREYDLKMLKKRSGKIKTDPDAAKLSISLWLDGSVLAYFKSEAERLSLPYQTLISSILHQYSTEELIEKKTVALLKGVNDF